MPLFSPAQTNLQLWAQLGASERPLSSDELTRLVAGYDLALELFSDHYRATKKPFIAHLVGTASIIASIGRPGDEIAAALLHAAYDQGDFGDARRKTTTRARRSRVSAAIGSAAERLVHRYHELSFDCTLLDRIEAAPDQVVEPELQIVLVLRLANALEEWLDGASYFAPEKASIRRFGNGNTDVARQRLKELAAHLGEPILGEAFATPPLIEVIPEVFRSKRGGSFQTRAGRNGTLKRLLSIAPFLRT
jgi:hypothetical protein